MSTVMVFFYPEQEKGFQVMETVEHLRSTGKIDLEELVFVTKNPSGKVKLHHHNNMPIVGATGGAVLGAILGMIFLLPYVGAVIGAAAGAVGAMVTDVVTDNEFLKTITAEMTPGSGAVFMLVRETPIEVVVSYLAKYGGKLAHTSLTHEQEENARKLFDVTAETRAQHRAELRQNAPEPKSLN